MAWRCSGKTNEELVEKMAKATLIENDLVKEAFLKVDRGHFAPNSPYEDSPQAIGYGATISAPHMHASAIENLLPMLVPGSPPKPRRILDVGSGSGYLTLILAEIAGPESTVVGIEHIQGLTDLGKKNVAKSPRGRELLASGRIKFVTGDGRQGWKDDGGADRGWDAIHVGAAAQGWPQALLDQLAKPGKMFIPVEDDYGLQDVWLVDKNEDGTVEKKKLFGVRYVPLTDARSQLES